MKEIPINPSEKEKGLQHRVYEGKLDKDIEFAAKANELATEFLKNELGK